MSLMDQFSTIFGAKPGAGVPTYEQLQMRRKIAESLLGQKSRYPKTFGEGLGAIGEAIGERGMMSRLDAMEAAKAAQDKATIDAIDNPAGAAVPPGTPPGTPPVTRSSYAPEGGEAPVQTASVSGDPWAARSTAIAGIESGGAKDPYSLLGAVTRTGDRAHGKYQVMGANIPDWTKAATGTAMTPQQFLASKDAQEAVFKHRFGGYVDKYGEEGAAKAWYGGERGMNNPNATDIHGRLTVRDYGQDYLKRLGPGASAGPRADVVDPNLNQSVALNPAEPPAPTGAPTAFAGQPASDAPPVGMPIAGQAPPPPDARAAIAGAITPKPAPVVAPPAPPAPAGPQIAQAPSQQPQIRVPEREPTPPPPPQATDRMRKIERALTTIGDPMQRDVLTRRYQQDALEQKAIYDQKFEEYKHKRDRWEAAPEKALTVQKAQQELIKTEQENKLRAQFGNMPPADVFKTVAESKKVAQSAVQSLVASKTAMEIYNSGIISGAGADWKLMGAKFLSGLGLTGEEVQKKIANTETFQSTMQPIIASILHQTSGTSQLSEGELYFAKQAAAGKITLDEKTFPKILAIIDKASSNTVAEHQQKMDVLFGSENKQAHSVYGVKMPADTPAGAPAGAPAPAAGIVDITSEAEAKNLKPGTKVRINGRIGTVQ